MEMRKPNVESVSFTTEEALTQAPEEKVCTSRERIWNPEVRVHGPIATVWAP